MVSAPPGRIGFVSLGCPKATVDSERILTEFRIRGCEMASEYAAADLVKAHFPGVLAVTGPQATEEVMSVVREHLPPVHDPFVDLVPPGGLKLTPRHYAYLKISEGCNHKCSFCIIPGMRGRLVSRGAASVMAEAESLVSAGIRELLMVSQDTSAYGADIRYRTEFHGARPVRSHIRGLGGLGPGYVSITSIRTPMSTSWSR